MSNERKVYPIEIAGVKRDLVLFQIKPGLTIAILNILGDTELVQACAKALNEKLKSMDYDVVVTSESKSIPLAHALSVENGKPYVIFRKTYKPYMGEALESRDALHHHRRAADALFGREGPESTERQAGGDPG